MGHYTNRRMFKVSKDFAAVFMGSSTGASPAYANTAQDLGRALALHGRDVVFGGNWSNGMGQFFTAGFRAALADLDRFDESLWDGIREYRPRMLGIVPSTYWHQTKSVPSPAFVSFKKAAAVPHRADMIHKRACAFFALPGSDGTFSEVTGAVEYVSSLTYAKKETILPPIIAVNTNGFFDDWAAQRERFVADGFSKPEGLGLVSFAADAQEAMVIFRTRMHRPFFNTQMKQLSNAGPDNIVT